MTLIGCKKMVGCVKFLFYARCRYAADFRKRKIDPRAWQSHTSLYIGLQALPGSEKLKVKKEVRFKISGFSTKAISFQRSVVRRHFSADSRRFFVVFCLTTGKMVGN